MLYKGGIDLTKLRNQEALELSEEILKNFELSELPTQHIVLKCLRLARLINDLESIDWLKQEANGFEQTAEGFLTQKAWFACSKSGRRYFEKDEKKKKPVEYAFTETIAVMEALVKVAQQRMEVAYDPDIAVSTHSPYNPVMPHGNTVERNHIVKTVHDYTEKIEKVKARIYEYVFNVNYELKFGNITEDIYTRKRSFVDKRLKEICPEAVQKFISVYDNLKSGNDEDWANAVHSCRRILKEVADQLFPPSDEPIIKEDTNKKINIGNDQYINRLILYIESKSTSEKFNAVVGSHLKYIGERIDSICEAANKGTHHEVTLEEAERYIIYTYLIIGDILSL